MRETVEFAFGHSSIWPIPATEPGSSPWPGRFTTWCSKPVARSRRSQACGWRDTVSARQYGELVQVFREIKDAFDPSNLLNPGKVVGDDPHLMVRDLKHFPTLTPPLDLRSGLTP